MPCGGTGWLECHRAQVCPRRCCGSCSVIPALEGWRQSPAAPPADPRHRSVRKDPETHWICCLPLCWTALLHSLPSCWTLSIITGAKDTRSQLSLKAHDVPSRGWLMFKVVAKQKEIFLTSKPWLTKFRIFLRTGLKQFSLRLVFPLVRHPITHFHLAITIFNVQGVRSLRSLWHTFPKKELTPGRPSFWTGSVQLKIYTYFTTLFYYFAINDHFRTANKIYFVIHPICLKWAKPSGSLDSF